MITLVMVIEQRPNGDVAVAHPVVPVQATPLEIELAREVSVAAIKAVQANPKFRESHFVASGGKEAERVSESLRRPDATEGGAE